MKCTKCGSSIFNMPDRYLERINPKGEPGIFECCPSCVGGYSSEEKAILSAIKAEGSLKNISEILKGEQ